MEGATQSELERLDIVLQSVEAHSLSPLPKGGGGRPFSQTEFPLAISSISLADVGWTKSRKLEFSIKDLEVEEVIPFNEPRLEKVATVDTQIARAIICAHNSKAQKLLETCRSHVERAVGRLSAHIVGTKEWEMTWNAMVLKLQTRVTPH
jgi:hypothetical protein